MYSLLLSDFRAGFSLAAVVSTVHGRGWSSPSTFSSHNRMISLGLSILRRSSRSDEFRKQNCRPRAAANGTANSVPTRDGVYTVSDFMTRRENLHVVRPTTTADEALELLVHKRVSGFPVVDDEWRLVGVVSDYDLLALDSISGGGQFDTNMFPVVNSTWKAFNEIQKLLTKTNGKVVGDLMTPSPLVVRENTNLEDAARLLLQTKYHRLPVVDAEGKLIGIITRGDVIKAALQIKQDTDQIRS